MYIAFLLNMRVYHRVNIKHELVEKFLVFCFCSILSLLHFQLFTYISHLIQTKRMFFALPRKEGITKYKKYFADVKRFFVCGVRLFSSLRSKFIAKLMKFIIRTLELIHQQYKNPYVPNQTKTL